MQVIPVLDLANGLAVHARGGRREAYLPVRSCLLTGQPGDAAALMHAYRDVLAAPAAYIADLDALQNATPQRAIVRQLVKAFDGPVLVDAGLRHPAGSLELLTSGIGTVVLGLESLPSLDVLSNTLMALSPTRVALSLDLRNGQPLLAPAIEVVHGRSVTRLATLAVGLGVMRLILLDVGRVGRAGGVDLALVGELRRLCPDVHLDVGGGVRSLADLEALADLGVDGALVATAVHDGHVGAAQIAALGVRQSKARSVL